MLKAYYYLTKPGIIMGNAWWAAAGFFVAAQGHPNWWLFAAFMIGLSLIIASACVFNNFIDRGIDAKMARTKNRALATGTIPGPHALIFGTTLGLLGGYFLWAFTNWLALAVALFGWFFYVVVYGWAKRTTEFSTLVGSIPGAVPPVGGYVAVTHHLDTGAWLLFFIVVLWQMPHFFAIAIYRLKDYSAAGLPVLPVKTGIANTKLNMLFYTFAFAVVAPLLSVFGYVGLSYRVVAIALGIYWLWLCLKGFKAADAEKWARQMFKWSLVIVMVLSVVMSIDAGHMF